MRITILLMILLSCNIMAEQFESEATGSSKNVACQKAVEYARAEASQFFGVNVSGSGEISESTSSSSNKSTYNNSDSEFKIKHNYNHNISIKKLSSDHEYHKETNIFTCKVRVEAKKLATQKSPVVVQKKYTNTSGDDGKKCGFLKQVKEFKKGLYLNIGSPHPNQTITFVLWQDYRHSFELTHGSPYSMMNKWVCAKGKIKKYKNIPQIKLVITNDSSNFYTDN